MGDHVPYFAMARHDDPMGHAITLRSFAHENEKPKWGVYDGCGSHCADERQRWCGCSHEPDRGYPSTPCSIDSEYKGERHFAVYKIDGAPQDLSAKQEPSGESEENHRDDKQEEVDSAAPADKEEAQKPASSASHGGRPYWQLSKDEGQSGEPSIEIVVPKGTVPEAKGREVLFFNATGKGDASPELEAGASAASEEAVDRTTTAEASANTGEDASPVGKVRLPVGVNPKDCSWENGKLTEDGNQVLRCNLKKDEVKTVPIKVIDEL